MKDATHAAVHNEYSPTSKTAIATEQKLDKDTFTLSEKDLSQYTGLYSIETYNIDVRLEIRNGSIWSSVPGAADSELVPVSKDIFTVRGQQGFTISFQMDGSKATGFTSIQPDGTFKAILKNQ